MTKSYIALVSEGHLTKRRERKIILESIFKFTTPSIDGDIQPHPAMEIVNNLKNSIKRKWCLNNGIRFFNYRNNP